MVFACYCSFVGFFRLHIFPDHALASAGSYVSDAAFLGDDPPIHLEPGRVALVQDVQPIRIEEVAEIDTARIIAFDTLPYAPHVDITPQDNFVSPEFRANVSHAIEIWTDERVFLEIHQHDANSAVYSLYYGSCDVFIVKGLILFDVHAAVQDYEGSFDDSSSLSRVFWTTLHPGYRLSSPMFPIFDS
ncbi:hypothetical protein EVAR_25861_1 [Eumeta japonica]|uniref:Uncharacterized protein n=1 Tax=Eumeta variegata TaxID=151549 RepID=A0A4C1X4Y2_EUMVA|nr:hypothetical protein EVAR_25861_1 [Eumeta japonica]